MENKRDRLMRNLLEFWIDGWMGLGWNGWINWRDEKEKGKKVVDILGYSFILMDTILGHILQ